MARTGIVRDERYMDHLTGEFHPESHRRLEAIYEMLDERDMNNAFEAVPVRPASREELQAVHSENYIDMVAGTAGKPAYALDPDTRTSAGSYEAALLAAGGLNQAISMILEEKLDNAFALVRPPGHHAEKSRAMGFCLFNNVAVGASYAQRTYGIERVLIADWDLHHGNGTQHSFEDDPSILYFSTHQYPYYPGSGAFQETGRGDGKGYTINVPLSTGHGDGEYVAIFDAVLRPVALDFRPELILVSAGFDIYADDPLGGMKVTTEGFAGLTRLLMDIAEECCGGKIVLTLEGGYHLRGLRNSVKAVLNELSDKSTTDVNSIISRSDRKKLDYVLKNVSQVHGGVWKAFA